MLGKSQTAEQPGGRGLRHQCQTQNKSRKTSPSQKSTLRVMLRAAFKMQEEIWN